MPKWAFTNCSSNAEAETADEDEEQGKSD
jgi:hypothetical protein